MRGAGHLFQARSEFALWQILTQKRPDQAVAEESDFFLLFFFHFASFNAGYLDALETSGWHR